ncbi:MAG: hypothetical protein LPK80_07375 [Bacteroidota bacterium]|nr:hypothetical protein [Bacteroidota bacterium]MDX5447735.1 hypothetical protein [Bacteroidota bacterium]
MAQMPWTDINYIHLEIKECVLKDITKTKLKVVDLVKVDSARVEQIRNLENQVATSEEKVENCEVALERTREEAFRMLEEEKGKTRKWKWLGVGAIGILIIVLALQG